jgi:hypothetical protein
MRRCPKWSPFRFSDVSFMSVTYPAHLIHLDVITPVICGEYPPGTASLLGPGIAFSTLFSTSSIYVQDQVSRPQTNYEPVSNIMEWYFRFSRLWGFDCWSFGFLRRAVCGSLSPRHGAFSGCVRMEESASRCEFIEYNRVQPIRGGPQAWGLGGG